MKATVMRTAILVAVLVAGVAYGGGAGGSQPNPRTVYYVTKLPSIGGTISRGNSINNMGWVAGYSFLSGNLDRHATLWLNGSATDLLTLGGANSSVAWPVKNTIGLITGISQTTTPDTEIWSCGAFFTGLDATGHTCLGFVWDSLNGMKPLPTLGGNNGFATGSNNLGEIAGWAENTVHDSTCVAPQVFQFRAVIWEHGSGDQVRELPVFPGDTSSAATAINNRGQVVGISGICDQAVGRYTGIHAVLWENDKITDIGNLGRLSWNTPMAINQGGEVAGFAPVSDTDPDNPQLHAFLWTKHDGIKDLQTVPNDLYSEAHGINGLGQIVGVSCSNADGSGVCRAFIWQGGVMTDLNSLLAPGSTVVLTIAEDINDLGVITGRAVDSITGERLAFVATPVQSQK